ncbi:MAG: hypothetical protein ACHREM_00565 [Polyangiales bacterium]
MIAGWYIPSWNGDFRVVADDGNAERSVLEVVNPTLAERATLDKALAEMKKRGWVGDGAALDKPKLTSFLKRVTGRAKKEWSFSIDASVERVGAVLAEIARPGPAVLTAVHYCDGRIVTTSNGPAGLEQVADEMAKARVERERAETAAAKAKPADKPKADAAVVAAKEKEPKAVVTVRRPTPSCPLCQPGAITPASEVLLAFLNEEEHETWAKERAIIVIGGETGHRYMLAHRNSDLAIGNTKICRDLDTNSVIHFHDWRVPPEEEVLAAKLILEHREPWLRNEATLFDLPSNRGEMMRFKNPFGNMMDGVADAQFTDGIGRFAKLLLSPPRLS